MKKLIFIMFFFAGVFSAAAQTIPEWNGGDLKKKGTHIAVGGVKLDTPGTYALLQDIGGDDLVASWQKNVRMRQWGLGLTIGGYTTAAVGFCFGGIYLLAGIVGTVFVAIGGQEAVDNLWSDIGPKASAGMIVSGVGLAAGTTGVVLLAKGNRRLRKTVDYCNSTRQSPAQLSFGPTRSGIGLAYNF